jgi:hypothetical protein
MSEVWASRVNGEVSTVGFTSDARDKLQNVALLNAVALFLQVA